jgi:hypothetical protein
MKEDSIPNELDTIAIQLDSILMQLDPIVAKSVDSENIFNTEVTVGIITFVGVFISAFINRYYSKKIINEEYDLKFNEKIIDKKIKAYEAIELITKEIALIVTVDKSYHLVFSNLNRIRQWGINLTEMISSYHYTLNDYESNLLYDIQSYKTLLLVKANRICNESIKGMEDKDDENLIKLGVILRNDFNLIHSALISIIYNFYNMNNKTKTKKEHIEINNLSLDISLREDEIKNLYKRE